MTWSGNSIKKEVLNLTLLRSLMQCVWRWKLSKVKIQSKTTFGKISVKSSMTFVVSLSKRMTPSRLGRKNYTSRSKVRNTNSTFNLTRFRTLHQSRVVSSLSPESKSSYNGRNTQINPTRLLRSMEVAASRTCSNKNKRWWWVVRKANVIKVASWLSLPPTWIHWRSRLKGMNVDNSTLWGIRLARMLEGLVNSSNQRLEFQTLRRLTVQRQLRCGVAMGPIISWQWAKRVQVTSARASPTSQVCHKSAAPSLSCHYRCQIKSFQVWMLETLTN